MLTASMQTALYIKVTVTTLQSHIYQHIYFLPRKMPTPYKAYHYVKESWSYSKLSQGNSELDKIFPKKN